MKCYVENTEYFAIVLLKLLDLQLFTSFLFFIKLLFVNFCNKKLKFTKVLIFFADIFKKSITFYTKCYVSRPQGGFRTLNVIWRFHQEAVQRATCVAPKCYVSRPQGGFRTLNVIWRFHLEAVPRTTCVAPKCYAPAS